MPPQDASRTRPRRLQDGSKTTSNRFESEIASYIAFGTPKLPPNGFQKHSKMLPERTLTPCQFRQTDRQRHTDRQSDKQLSRQTDTQTDKQTDGQADAQRDKSAPISTHPTPTPFTCNIQARWRKLRSTRLLNY